MPQLNGAVSAADDLDNAGYDPISHLNTIFSHPSTLSRAQPVLHALQMYQNDLDGAIFSLVAKQAISDTASIERIQSAKEELADMFTTIETVRERAVQTEEAITEMTADIKRLDNTKRNLTLSMTALKRLQMLTTAYEQLRGLGKSRQYKDCAQLLQAVIQLMAHFKSYRSIDQIAALSRSVADLQRELLEQVCEDFESAFAKGETAQKKTMLSEGCYVLEALGDNARSRLITWYCNASLREYRQIFRSTDEAGSLDNISRRYAWFNRMLKTYDIEHAAVFPPYWKVNEMLANAFCETTRDDFKGILQRFTRRTDGQLLDVNLLLSCLQETLDFEHGLENRFSTGSRTSFDTLASVGEDKSHGFEQAISEAFVPYLSLWVEVQDKQLATLLRTYRQQPPRNTDEDFSPQMVMPSSTELFQFYRLTLAQCAKLSTGKQLLELTQTFAKYLDQYSQQVLFYCLGDRAGPQGPPAEDIVIIINTADYCYATTTQLEEKIMSRIDEEFKSKVDLQSQADSFMGVAGAGVRALVRKVEMDCEPGFREMRNIAWSKLENTGDQSSYVGELVKHIRSRTSEFLSMLHKQQYARAFCDNLVDALTNTYMTNIAQCRPISEAGAEQMLLDFYVMKKAFTELPTLNSEKQQAQTQQVAYAKRVTQTTAKIDPLLKTLQVHPVPNEALVQAYLIHIADSSETNFRKILEMKGITRKQDQANLVELFNAHKSSRSQTLSASSPILGQFHVSVPTQTTSASGLAAPFGQVGSAMSTPNLAGAASFGSAILSAARDGVDRLGTPSIVGNTSNSNQPSGPAMSTSTITSTLPSRTGSPAIASNDHVSVNDNLRNIGKFFRRDISGLARFGGGKGGEDAK